MFHFILFLIFIFFKKFFIFLRFNIYILLFLYFFELVIIIFNIDDPNKEVLVQNVEDQREKIALSQGENFNNTEYIDFYFETLKTQPEVRFSYNQFMSKRKHFEEAAKQLNTNVIPLSGPIMSKVLSKNEDGIFKFWYTDRYGFKNPDSNYDKEIDAIVIGDGMIQATTQTNDKDIAGVLTNKHSMNSLNFGINGISFLTYYALFKEYALNLKPKNIIFAYFESNDLTELRDEYQDKLLLSYLDNNTQNLMKKTKISKELIDLYQAKRREFYLTNKKNFGAYKAKSEMKKIKMSDMIFFQIDYNYTILEFLKLQKLRKTTKFHYFTQPSFQYKKLENIFYKIKTESLNKNIKIHFLYLPSWKRFNEFYGNQFVQLMAKNKVLRLADKYFDNVIDITPVMEQMNANDFFPYGLLGHYNEKGLELIADEISKALDY